MQAPILTHPIKSYSRARFDVSKSRGASGRGFRALLHLEVSVASAIDIVSSPLVFHLWRTDFHKQPTIHTALRCSVCYTTSDIYYQPRDLQVNIQVVSRESRCYYEARRFPPAVLRSSYGAVGSSRSVFQVQTRHELLVISTSPVFLSARKLIGFDTACFRRRERLPFLPLHNISSSWSNRPISYRIEMNFNPEYSEHGNTA